jgi:hypothetical protein
MVVLAAQGVADSLVLPHLGAVFRHPRYNNMSLEEWSLVTVNEKAAVFKSCSKHCLCAYHFHFFVEECLANHPPTHLEDICCFRGFSKKSGCLYLFAVYGIQFGIATDSHVQDTAFKLGWTPFSSDEVRTSCALELWIPQLCYEKGNLWIAGLRQLLSSSAYITSALRTCAREFGDRHNTVLANMEQKRLKASMEQKDPKVSSPTRVVDSASINIMQKEAKAIVHELKQTTGWKSLIATEHSVDKPMYQTDIRHMLKAFPKKPN